MQRRWAYGEHVRSLSQRCLATVCHGKAATSTIGCNIDAAMIARIPTARPSIPWREDRTDKADDRNGTLAIIADAINIPPGIATWRHLYVKVRSLKIAAAGEVEKMRDELECMREELEEAKRDRELAINFAGGAADDVAKAAAEEAEALREKAAAAREHAATRRVATQLNVRHADSLNIRVRDATGEETFFKIKKTTKMHKIFHAYCTRKGKPVTAFRFLFDGQRVDGEQTAEDIDMEDGDQIDALNELLHVTIKFAPSDSPRSLMIPATSTVADLRTALGIGAGPRFVWMGRLLDDDTKSLVEYGVEDGQAIIVQGRPSPADLSD